MGAAAAGERVRGLGRGQPPLQQVRILNALIIMSLRFPPHKTPPHKLLF